MNPMAQAHSFHIETPAYEGPFELMLELIEARKLLVNDFALASITEDFIEHVRAQDVFPMDEAAQFIQVAATLLLIKSKSLLPDLEFTDEERGDVEDLKLRLIAYEKVRDASRALARLFSAEPLAAAGERAPEPIFAPARDLTASALGEALSRLLASREAQTALPEARVKPMITIEEMMGRLATRVQAALSLSFKEFTGPKGEKTLVIVSFLALLELVRQGAVAVEQFGHGGDIRISHTAPEALPRYG